MNTIETRHDAPRRPVARPSLHPALRGALVPLVVATVVFWVAYDGGTYALTSRNSLALVVWWAIMLLVGLGLWPRARVPREALVTGAFLAAFAAWTGCSVAWAESAEKALDELNRATLYLGLFAVPVLAAVRGRGAQRWIAGLALGIAAVGVLALASRFFPNSFSEPRRLATAFPSDAARLAYPLDYWNGLATLLAFAFPLLLHLALFSRTSLARAAALAPIPALAAAVYLTSSRGGSIAALAGVLAFLVLTTRRWAALVALLLAASASAAAVAVVAGRPALVDAPSSASAASEGRGGAALVALVCVCAGVAHLLAGRVRIDAPRLRTGLRVVILALGLVLAAAALVVADPRRRLEEFTRQSPELADPSLQAHLLSAGGRGRWQMWEAAIGEFRASPFLGGGAGSYEAWWAEHRPILVFVRNAHSLYLETLAELGAVGLLLLAGFLLAALVSAARRLRAAAGEERSAVAALIAVFVVFLLEAAIDWIWQIPAVTGVAVVAVGVATGAATVASGLQGREERRSRRPRLSLRLAVALAAWPVLALQALPLLAEAKMDGSREAAARGDFQRARADALAARALEPWASSPRVQLALVEEQVGELEAARAAVDEAIERDRGDWRLWLVKARLETKAGDVRAARKSLARAVARNPLSPLFRPGG